MKTLLIATKKGMESHVGEEYDDIMEVEVFMDIGKMQEHANLIRNKIRELASKDISDGKDAKIVITLEATPQYNVILVSLCDTMKSEEKIDICLPEKLNKAN